MSRKESYLHPEMEEFLNKHFTPFKGTKKEEAISVLKRIMRMNRKKEESMQTIIDGMTGKETEIPETFYKF